MTDIEKWLAEQAAAERDEWGLTESQRDHAEVEAAAIMYDWLPKVRFLAAKLDVDLDLACSLYRLVLEKQRWMDNLAAKERSDRYLDRAEQYLDDESDGEDWRG